MYLSDLHTPAAGGLGARTCNRRRERSGEASGERASQSRGRGAGGGLGAGRHGRALRPATLRAARGGRSEAGRWRRAAPAAAPGRAGGPEPPRAGCLCAPWSGGEGDSRERRVPAPPPPPPAEARAPRRRREQRPRPAGGPWGGGVEGRGGRRERAAMPGPLPLLCLLALGLRGAAEPSGAAPPPCAPPCSCDGDRRVDCSGKGLTAVPEGLSAFTQALWVRPGAGGRGARGGAGPGPAPGPGEGCRPLGCCLAPARGSPDLAGAVRAAGSSLSPTSPPHPHHARPGPGGGRHLGRLAPAAFPATCPAPAGPAPRPERRDLAEPAFVGSARSLLASSLRGQETPAPRAGRPAFVLAPGAVPLWAPPQAPGLLEAQGPGRRAGGRRGHGRSLLAKILSLARRPLTKARWAGCGALGESTAPERLLCPVPTGPRGSAGLDRQNFSSELPAAGKIAEMVLTSKTSLLKRGPGQL